MIAVLEEAEKKCIAKGFVSLAKYFHLANDSEKLILIIIAQIKKIKILINNECNFIKNMMFYKERFNLLNICTIIKRVTSCVPTWFDNTDGNLFIVFHQIIVQNLFVLSNFNRILQILEYSFFCK